jgi:hypothetical protein
MAELRDHCEILLRVPRAGKIPELMETEDYAIDVTTSVEIVILRFGFDNENGDYRAFTAILTISHIFCDEQSE